MTLLAVNPRRARLLAGGRTGAGPVVCWMHRDMRARDNWTLLFALEMARNLERPVAAAFCLDPDYPAARLEHFAFLLAGLDELERALAGLNVPLALLLGDPPARLADLVRRLDAAAVVTDFDPLRHKRRWLDLAAKSLGRPLYEVDSRNVVPCFVASDKAEYMARTIRPKIHRLLPEFLEDFPEAAPVPAHLALTAQESLSDARDPDRLRGVLGVAGIRPPRSFVPGEAAAARALADFLRERLSGYATRRNLAHLDGQSNLSPWLHFGMLSAQRAALETARAQAPAEDKEAFLEELIVRRELADNFCFHTPRYDSVEGFPAWARASHEAHLGDPRPALYDLETLEAARTGDPAWNAAQRQMASTGKMHGYMRMYWGKKILEWSPDAATALARVIALNDRYSLDGRDPNGYAGAAWCVGGVHDRAWGNRPVFGLVRSMTLAGLKRKFDLTAYLHRVARQQEEAEG
ncbi:deoxyribodipyrimidine photo-lyase [Fundidesulfovibrio butyratiphilus]